MIAPDGDDAELVFTDAPIDATILKSTATANQRSFNSSRSIATSTSIPVRLCDRQASIDQSSRLMICVSIFADALGDVLRSRFAGRPHARRDRW